MARILIVDDHPHIVRLLQRELEAEGHEVSSAATGEAALEQLRQQMPDIVLLDVMLPGMSGLDVLREMKVAGAPTAHVVLLTARDHPSDIAYGLELGADWYLTKPFQPGDVATVVSRFVTAPRAAVSGKRASLPLVEIDRFTTTAADSFDLAVRGNVAAGLCRLQSGLQRAAMARASGEPWADELEQR